MKKTPEQRLSLVRKMASRLRQTHHLTLPVDLERLAALERIQVKTFHSQSGIDGYADLDCDKPVIYINAEQPYQRRRRFTMAHEIGHVQIPWHTDATRCVTDDPSVYIQKRKKIDSQEYEANVFASELLIPSDWLAEAVSRMTDLDTLLSQVVTQTNASVMACLYALEHVLPAGHVIFAATEAMEYWKSFRSGNTLSSRAGCRDPFTLADRICLDKEEFTRGSYRIRSYRLLPCPGPDRIRSDYDACGTDLGVFLDTLTGGHPERALHCLRFILACIPESVYVFLESYDDNRLVRYRTPECHLYPEIAEASYDALASVLDAGSLPRRELRMAGGKRLSWVKVPRYEAPPPGPAHSGKLLRALVYAHYEDPQAAHVLRHINGVIGNLVRQGVMSAGEMYARLKARFCLDALVHPFFEDPEFDRFLSNRIHEILARRNDMQ